MSINTILNGFQLYTPQPLKIFLIICIGLFLIIQIKHLRQRQKLRKAMRKAGWYYPEEIGPIYQNKDFAGVYIWQRKGLLRWRVVYVGQSIHVIARFKQHINGHGNPALHQDYLNGDDLRFMAIPLKNSGFKSLDVLEKHLISKYNTYHNIHCYNKTSGNGHAKY